ncbi:MAG: hypothetical protein DMG32_02215, partial [Acidobacteria bacterium]
MLPEMLPGIIILTIAASLLVSGCGKNETMRSSALDTAAAQTSGPESPAAGTLCGQLNDGLVHIPPNWAT